ncbi:hypothetical protein GCM10018980_70890 [Streptomyces capoamus]|uniref:Uncharacterized protein n=1 Tax=Streptomyces capoamus TaxID=68183 RepID=A0A919F2T3_9ACTN|nr:hypothetical protein GCM10010501_17230 [Streptomyces libani subsp. rufus]GHG74144.1 hypothetical protein GCM10018980_70890 [Streptomyces capoamus]
MADTRTSCDTVAAGYADLMGEAQAREPYLRAALALFAESVHAAGCDPAVLPGGLSPRSAVRPLSLLRPLSGLYQGPAPSGAPYALPGPRCMGPPSRQRVSLRRPCSLRGLAD